jgi:hypothetical protein
MSFLAAFFAIDTNGVPQKFKLEGSSGLDVVYKYVVGLGLGTAGFIIVVALYYQSVWAIMVDLWKKHMKWMKLSKMFGRFESFKSEQSSKSTSGDSPKSGSSTSILCLPLRHRRDRARRDVETGEGSSE